MCSANIHIHCYIERVRNMPGGTDKMTKDIRTSLREVATRGGRYFKGTAQLFLASGSEFVDNKLPTVGAMVETNRELLQDTARFLRNPVDAVNRTINKAMDTPDFKALKKFGKAMVDDLKSGELYNADRMRSSFGETVDDLLDGFGDFDMSGFGEDGEWTEPEGDAGFDKEAKLAESQEQAADTRTSSTISAIGLGTDALVHTANANAQTNIRLSLKQHSQLMAGVQNMVTQQAATLQAVNQTAISLLDVTREAHQQIMTCIEGISTTLQRIEKNTAPVQPERASVREELEVIGSNGELNIANWLKQIKKNADDKYNISSMLTMATGGMGISALLEQVGDNPWQLVSDALLQRMLPPSLKKQFDITGKKLEGFFPALLSKLNDRGKRYGSGESNKLSDFFAGLLGYEERSRRTIDTTTRDPSAQAMFTNRTAQAIENVIPMWLSKIHSALTGDEEQVFDYGAGKFTRVVDVLSQTSNSVNDLANRMGNAAGNFLDLAKSVRFENADMESKFHDYLYRYLQTQAERGQFIDPFVSKEKFKETMPSVTDGDSDLYYKIINSALRRMDRTDLLALSSEIQGARQSRHKANAAINNRIRDNGTWIAFSDAIDKQKSRAVINKSQDTAYGLRGQDMEDVLEKQRASALRRGGAQATNLHLNDISSMLRRGIVTYTYIMGSAFSTEGLPPGIARTMTEARKAAEDEQKNKFDVSAERDERVRQNRQDRERLIRERRQQQVNRIERDPGEWYVNGDTDQGYIDQMLAETRLRQRASTDTLFDNPDVERTSKTGYEAGQRDLRDKMARASRDMNERLDKSKFGGLVETAREYGKVPFELVENGLKLVDSFLFRVLYGEDASDVMLDEHKLPSILDAVRINVKAQWLEAGNWFAKNIGDPLKKSLFDSEEGIIPRIANRLNEKVVEPVKNKVKDYKNKLIGAREVGEDGKPIGDYVGGRFSDKINAIRHRADDVKSGIASGAKSSFTSTINKWLYGDNVEGKGVGHSLQQVGTTKTKRGYTDRTGYHEEEVETPILADVQEFTGIIGSLKKRALDIRGMLFGEDDNGDDHDSWNKFNLVRDEIKKAFPDMTIGAGLGLLGSFFLPGGPILGAMLGSAGGFVASSEKFKEYLFGEQIAEDTQMRFNYKTGKIEETKVKSRSGGIIDKQIYDAFKKFAPNIAIGSGLGIVGSMFLPGGPMIGALMGGIGGMVSASDQMKELIFGEYTDKDGNVKDGLLGPKTREAIKNAAGPALGGAVLGGTAWSMISSLGIIPGLSLLPGGPIFTMLGGITGAMNADAIKNFFFGKEEEGTEEVKDENGNVTGTKKVKKRVGGLFGTAFDFAKTKMIEPFAKRINAAGEKIGEWFNESVVSPFRNAIAPIKEHMKRAGTAISDSMKNIGEHIKDSIAKMFSNPDDPDDPREQMKRFFKDRLITPLDNAVKKIFSTIGKIIGSIISAPFKALEFIATGTIGGKSPEELSDERAAARKAKQAERDKKRTEKTKGRLGRIWGRAGGRLGKIFGKYAPGDDAEAQEAEARPEQSDRYVRNAAGKWTDANTKRFVSDVEVEEYQRSQSASAGEKRGIFSRIAGIFKRDDSGAENLGPGVNRNRQKEQVAADESAKKDKDASARDSERDRLAQKEEKRTRGKADASVNESEGQTAMAGEDGGKAKKSITGRKSNNEYLRSIDRHTGRIYDEIKGQLGGSGWNIAYIKTLLDKHFGKLNDDELPEEMEGSKKVKKRRGFFGRILDRVEGVFHSVTDAVGGAVERAVGVITAPFKLVGKVITGLKDAVVGATTTLWGIAKTLGSAVGELLKGAAKGLGEVMVGVGKMIRGAAGGIGEALGNVLSTFTGVLGDGVLATSAVVRGLIESAAVIAPDVVATVWKGMKTVGGIIGKGVTFLGKGVVDGVTGLFGKIFGRDKDKDGEGHGFDRSKKMTIKGPVPVTIYDQGDGPDYVQYPFISTVSPVMPSRAIPVFLVGAFSDAIVTARLSKDEEPQQPAAPDSSGAPGPSPMPNIGGSDDPDQAGDIDPSAEGGGARPTNGTVRKKSKLKSAMNDLRTRLHGLGSDIKGAVASAKMNHEMDRVWDNYMKSHENDKEAQADPASRALTVYKRQYSAIDAKAERSNNPADEYDDAIKHARSMEEIQAIQASHQMNASNQMVATGQQEEEKKEGILGMLLGGLASLIFGKGGLKGALSALGKKFAGSTAGKAIGSFASKTALPFLGEAAGMAATGYQLFGENGNKLWGAETVAMDALKIGKAVAGNADEVLEKSPIKKAIAKLIKSLTTNQTVVKMFGAAKNKLGTLAAKLTNKLGGEVLEQAMKSGAQQAKGAIKQIAAFASGGTIAIAFAIADFVAGFGNAKKYFNVFGSDVSLGMRLTSGIVNTLGGLLSLIPGIGPLLSVAAAMFQDSIVQLVYGIVADDSAKEELAANQQKLQAATDKYNAENGTNLTTDEYAKKFNADGSKRGFFSNIVGGIKSVGSGIVGGAKKLGGAVVGGVKKAGDFVLGAVKGVPDFIANGANWIGKGFETVGAKLNEFVTNLPQMVSNGVTGLFNKIGDVLTNLPTTIGKFIGDSVGTVIKGVGGIGEFAVKLGGGIINGVIKIAGGVGNMLLSIAKGIGNILLSGVKLVFETPQILGNLAIGIGKGVINTIGSAIGGVNNLISEIVKGIGNAIKEALGGLGEAVDEAIESIPGVGDVYKGAKKVGGAIGNAVSAADGFVEGIPLVGSVYKGAKDLGGKALDLAENIPLAGGLIKGVRGLFGGSEEEEESGKGSGWGRGPKTSISVDSLLNRVISTVSSTVKDTISMAQQAAQGNGLDTGSIGGFFKSAISDPKALMSTFLQVGKGIGGSLIDMVSDVFKGKKNGPTIFSIMGEGLGSSLIADLKNTEGKNATITNSMSTAMTASLTGGSSTAVRNAVKETKKKKGLIETVGSWMPWNWGKGAGCDDCDGWGTGRVTPMSQSSGKWNRGSDDMAKAGCGPTAAAMVASSYGSKTANPMEANRMSKISGMRASDGGTNPKFFGKYAAAHGYGMSEGPVDSRSIASNLRKGQPVVVMGKGGAFGKNMHYMVAERDTGRGGVGIVDPLTGARKSTTMEGLVGNTKTAIYSYGKGSGWGRGPKDSVDDIWTRNSMSNEERQEKAGKTIGDTGYTTTQAQKALVDKMASIKGQIAYSLKGGEQNPDIGKASCASTVGWAYRKVLGVNNMSAGSTIQSKDNRFSTIWVNNGTPLDPSILQPGDILYQHWDQTRNNGKMQHTEMYAGNNQDLSHGGGSNGTEYGPTYKELTPYRKSHTMMVRRYNPFIEGTNVQVYDTSTTGYSGNTGSSSGSTSGTSIAGSTQGLGMLDALSTVFSGISSKIGNILTILMGGKPEDDTGDAESAGTTETTSASGGTTFNFGSSAGVMNPTDSATAIWKFLRREGYTEPGAAGIMGCWQSESSNRADRLEGDYLKAWKSKYGTVDNVMSSNANLNDYVVNYLFPAYDRSGISISKSGYKMADGNYYPGLGLAQWTKGRAYNLMNFAKERGEDWRNLNTQLEFFKHETETSYPKLKGMLNAAQTPEEGARAGLDGFEMYSGWSSTKKGQEQWKERAMNAAQIYNAYKGTDIRTDDEKQIEAGRARRNWTADPDGNIVVPDSSSTTDDGETGTGWGRGPGANLSANVSIMQSRIAALNKNMESLREETASESTVAEVTRKITEAMDSATGGGGDEQQTKVLSGIYALMGKMVELLSDIKENTKQKDPGTPDETDNSYRKLPTAKPRYPNGDDTVDDVGAVTIDRLTGI